MSKNSTISAPTKSEQANAANISKDALVGCEALLETLFPDERDRPSKRWLASMRQRRLIPFVKIGSRMVYYDLGEVRAALKRNFTVSSK